MSKFIVTPWRTQQDLLQVRQQLYRLDDSSSSDTRRYAVNRVMAWRLRGNLPHAVESTALLVDAFLHHDITANSSFSIRAVYSAAFCRFVTGFCDIGRSRERSLEPSSMLEIAKQIDMPVNFVSLRHEATHEELPSEQRIVAACEDALQWLWQVYWSRLTEDVQGEDQREQTENETVARAESCRVLARKSFRHYRSTKRHSLKGRTVKASTKHVHNTEETLTPLLQACNGERAAIDAVVAEVVAEDLLIPSERELGSSLDGAFLIWDELLLHLCNEEQDFTTAFVSGFLASVSPPVAKLDESRQEAYSLWVEHICCSAVWQAVHQQSASDIKSIILKHCVLYSNASTGKLGHRILANADESFQERWRGLFNASQHSDEADEQAIAPSSRAVHTDWHVLDPDRGWHLAILPPGVPLGVVEV